MDAEKAPPFDAVSPLFHIRWGAEDMKAEFERQIKLGTTCQTVFTDGLELFGTGTRDRNGGRWKGRTGFATNRGRALDPRLKQDGVRIISGPRKADGLRTSGHALKQLSGRFPRLWKA